MIWFDILFLSLGWPPLDFSFPSFSSFPPVSRFSYPLAPVCAQGNKGLHPRSGQCGAERGCARREPEMKASPPPPQKMGDLVLEPCVRDFKNK